MTDSATVDSVRERIVDPLAERLAQEYGSSSVQPPDHRPHWTVRAFNQRGRLCAYYKLDPAGKYVRSADVLQIGSHRLLPTLRAEGLL